MVAEKKALLLTLTLLSAACASELDQSAYDTSCTQDDACFIQSYSSTECGLFALNVRDRDRVARDFETLSGENYSSCDTLGTLIPVCENQVCAIGQRPTCDPNAESDTCESPLVCTPDGLCNRVN